MDNTREHEGIRSSKIIKKGKGDEMKSIRRANRKGEIFSILISRMEVTGAGGETLTESHNKTVMNGELFP